MNRTILFIEASLFLTLSMFLAGCGANAKQEVVGDTAPPPAQVEPDMDASNFKVDHPEQFPVVTAGMHAAAPVLSVTGTIGADPSRQVPVISTATGRVVEINARVGDEVKQGQVLYKVKSTDIDSAYSDYQKAVRTEALMKQQLIRAQTLLKDGALPASQLEVAQTNEDTALIDVKTTTAHLKVLGADPTQPSDGIVEIHAPVSGIISDQQITASAAVQAYSQPNPLTISDMSHVWILCDVFENKLSQVHLNEYVDVHLNAYPDRTFKARISNISQVMDPVLHTAKVRLEVENPGVMRLGMFVTADFHGDQAEVHAMVPSSAILHLHDRDWVYAPAADNHFKRLEVVSGPMLPNNMQEVVSGIKPGDKVVSNALVLQSTVEQ